MENQPAEIEYVAGWVAFFYRKNGNYYLVHAPEGHFKEPENCEFCFVSPMQKPRRVTVPVTS